MTLMYVIFFYTLTEFVLFPYKNTMILEMYNDKIPQTTLLYFSKKKLTRNSATWDQMNSQNFKQNLTSTFFVLKDSTFTLTVTYIYYKFF